jgi:acyl carrier protein phosphodiesterase
MVEPRAPAPPTVAGAPAGRVGAVAACSGSMCRDDAGVNLLAHLVLAEPGGLARPAVLLGNVLPDLGASSTRGRAFSRWPAAVRAGIERHRWVDRRADAEPAFAEVVAMLRPASGRYAAVVADVLLDHGLSVGWARHHPWPRERFIAEAYARLTIAADAVPAALIADARPVLDRMIERDWLSRYATHEGIAVTLVEMSWRLSRRFDRPVDLTAGLDALPAWRPALVRAADVLMSALIGYAVAPPGPEPTLDEADR